MISQRRHPKQLPVTQPEIPAQPLAEKPAGRGKKNSTMPSPGSTRKSQRGRYAIHQARSIDVEAVVKELSSPSPPDVRVLAAKKLKAYVTDADRARDVMSILPADNSRLVSSVRAHCIEHIRKEIR
jgi:hypothetical protein